MCGRYTLRTKMNLLLSQFAAELAYESEYEARYNVAPTQVVPAVRLGENGSRQLVGLRWGLIPSWSKDAKIAYSTINARADSLATKPAFRSAFKNRRCLVVADGYYEWLKDGKEKQPIYYEVDGGQPFAFAGLWECWPGPLGQNAPVESCTIITTDANELAREVHDRMPAILDAKDYDAWLSCIDVPLVPFPAERMTARPVNRWVNNVKNQGEQCVAPPE
jgi:putative SOS response-associated peptidase YedK